MIDNKSRIYFLEYEFKEDESDLITIGNTILNNIERIDAFLIFLT